jgi:hypothetical protein
MHDKDHTIVETIVPVSATQDFPSSTYHSNKGSITITFDDNGDFKVNGAKQDPLVNLYVIPGASKLRRILKDTNELIICPGVYDGLSARVAMELGFKAMYMVYEPAALSKRIVETDMKNNRPVLEPRLLVSGWRTWDWPNFMI